MRTNLARQQQGEREGAPSCCGVIGPASTLWGDIKCRGSRVRRCTSLVNIFNEDCTMPANQDSTHFVQKIISAVRRFFAYRSHLRLGRAC